MALSRGQAPAIPFDVNRPWDSVWSAAVDDHAFWHRQLEEPALIILTKDGRLTDVVTGEAPIETRSGRRSRERPPSRAGPEEEENGPETKGRKASQSAPRSKWCVHPEPTRCHITRRIPVWQLRQHDGGFTAHACHGPFISATAVCLTSTMDIRAISHHVSQVMEKERKKKAKERTD